MPKVKSLLSIDTVHNTMVCQSSDTNMVIINNTALVWAKIIIIIKKKQRKVWTLILAHFYCHKYLIMALWHLSSLTSTSILPRATEHALFCLFFKRLTPDNEGQPLFQTFPVGSPYSATTRLGSAWPCSGSSQVPMGLATSSVSWPGWVSASGYL